MPRWSDGVTEIRPEPSDLGLFRCSVGAVDVAQVFDEIEFFRPFSAAQRGAPGRTKLGAVRHHEWSQVRPLGKFRRAKERRRPPPVSRSSPRDIRNTRGRAIVATPDKNLVCHRLPKANPVVAG